ncbi:DUF4361 domain-containing protein [Mucilaginibacter sp.]|uniref:BT_3044 domain-containing protein n=1 Tax=Mucilaginibacter sp. TaxID=1882438 RepID=UPI00261D0DBB|nr:DUF4361 domain-containing protein [Mucilaginibacter sp.]MDB4918420.1 hypothetical protein [Mucilaginibacter sp.]
MKKKFLQYMFLGCSLMLIFSSCRKDAFDNTTETGQSGKSYVYIDGGPVKAQYFQPFTTVVPVNMFILRRDAANTADNQKAITVTIKSLSIDDYNAANSTTYTAIPAALATQATDATITTAADGITMNFAAGVFAKNYVLNVDGSQFDPSKKYALYLAITNFGGMSKKVGTDTILCVLGVKNKYDGTYHASGTRIHPTLGTFTFDYDVEMTTSGATSINGPALADLHADLSLTVNPDNTVTPSSTAQTVFVPAGLTNTYDPATKTFDLHFAYNTGAPRILNVKLVKQ